jgi:hypothetical protein
MLMVEQEELPASARSRWQMVAWQRREGVEAKKDPKKERPNPGTY